jgi:hypothetical protein
MSTDERKPCYHCGRTETMRYGTYPNGKHRFKCRLCGRYFVDPATRAKRVELPSQSHLILKLRALAEKLGHTPSLNDIREQQKRGFPYSHHHISKLFGSYSDALRRAGLTLNYRRQFSDSEKEHMLEQLRRLSRLNNAPVSTDDVRAARRRGLVPPVSHYEKAFGSIAEALRAAGVGVKNRYTDEELIAILRSIDMRLDRPVLPSDIEKLFRQGKAPSPKVLAARFGGMRKARAAAGIKQRFRFANGVTGIYQRYTREEMVTQLQNLAERLGRPPSYGDITNAGRSVIASAPTFISMFGSMAEAWRAAGFQPRPRKYSDKEIVAALRSLKRQLGRFPARKEIREASRRYDCPHPETIERRLGRLDELSEWI